MQPVILHLCADLGSDSRYYQLNPYYKVIKVGKDIGVENFEPPNNVHGIIANPVCTDLSTAPGFDKKRDLTKAIDMVNHCLRIINHPKVKKTLRWWVIENPANGRLHEILGAPKAIYQPWHFGSPWTKKTALWGEFKMPMPLYYTWEKVPKIEGLYVRPGRRKLGLVYLHKSAIDLIPEWQWAKDHIQTDADLRSMCSDGFAKEFYINNI